MADPDHPRKFTEEFRRQIVQLYLAGEPRGELMAEYDLESSALSRRVKCCGEAGVTTEAAARTPRRRAPDRARARAQETAHGGGRFKTSGAYIRSKVAAIGTNSGKYPVSAMCGVLDAPRSTYYWAISHPEPERADDPIAADVVRTYEGNRRACGAPKIKRALARGASWPPGAG